MKKKVIAYLHTHWDREWYREYEVFRIRLLRVFDNVLNLLENNQIPSFYFDGQTAAIEDYLEIRPEKLDLVKQLIKNKKLFIGPFYTLVDEYLTDKNSFEHNLQIGLEYAKNLGCTDFIGYLADTFGHSKQICKVFKKFNIDKCVVWRGCPDEIPSEFTYNGVDTVNLIRGYFMDFFSAPFDIDKKAKLIEENLDKIAKKSGNVLLMPIGADHLGVELDIQSQILEVNSRLKNYEIILGSPFDYFELVKDNFKNYQWNDELRDNSITFILPGSYSSRLDVKRLNVLCCHRLPMADKLQKHFNLNYDNLIKYAYKLLLQNQAHDGICGCSTDDVHSENIMRYKKILQISQTIVDEVRFKLGTGVLGINIGNKPYSGIVQFEAVEDYPQLVKLTSRKGFDNNILQDTQKIPVTEDYTDIYTYLTEVENMQPTELRDLGQVSDASDIEITDNSISNSNISLKVIGNNILINNEIQLEFVDYIDNGDSYNEGPVRDDVGVSADVISTKKVFESKLRATLKIETSFFDVLVSVDKHSELLDFKIDWINEDKNHLIQAKFILNENIEKTYSEDFNELIEREFDYTYDIRKNLPKEKGHEAKTNTAPMQRFVWANDFGIFTKGITQYDVFENILSIPLLRATGVISNPYNSSRTTPAGPPLEVSGLQQLGRNIVEFSVYNGDVDGYNRNLDKVFNSVIY
ncbi:MAG: hypothetical protein ACI37S_03600 [Candidatus Gastranaerophilaceae bacterium]